MTPRGLLILYQYRQQITLISFTQFVSRWRLMMSETNFTKLFSSITASTIWSEDAPTKVVWITMLAMADAAGFVYASVPGLSKISGVSMDETVKALDILLSPDEWSRDKDNEGRRIEALDGGWAILNHPKYRKIRDIEERRAYQREFMREKRAKEKKNVSSGVSNVSTCEQMLAKEEGEAEEDLKTCARFDEFWAVWPKKDRKAPALTKWKNKKLDNHADEIIADVKARIDGYDKWRENIYMHPATYLNQEAWKDEWKPESKTFSGAML